MKKGAAASHSQQTGGAAAPSAPSGLPAGPGAGARTGPGHGAGLGVGWRRARSFLWVVGGGRGVHGLPGGRRAGPPPGFSAGPLAVPVVFTAPASSSVHPPTGLSRTLGSPAAPVVGRAAGSVSLVAAAAGSSAPAVPVVVVVARRSARRTPLLRLHLVGRLPVALGELDLDLAAADPLPVQAVQSIFCVPHVLEYAEQLRFQFLVLGLENKRFRGK